MERNGNTERTGMGTGADSRVVDSLKRDMRYVVKNLAIAPRSLEDPADLHIVGCVINEDLQLFTEGASDCAIRFQRYQGPLGWYGNLIVRMGDLPGVDPIVVGAHYDSFPGSPGADDNASSVAVLFMLLQALSPHAASFAVPLEFAFWACEEPPAFASGYMGSAVQALELRDRGEKAALAIVLDMVGYYAEDQGERRVPGCGEDFLLPAAGDFLLLDGDDPAVLAAAAAAIEQAGLPVVCTDRPSDLLSWCDALNWKGAPRLLLTDTGMLRNDRYHTPRDRPGTLDYGRMASLVIGLEAFLLKAAMP